MHTNHFKNLAGKKVGNLTYLKRVGENKHKQSLWKCRCECGNTTIVVSGKTQSCGCISSRLAINSKNRTHGMRHSPEYAIWCKIKNRCHNPNYHQSFYYSERNIKVCDEWRKSFLAFFNHIGKRPSSKHSIDRIDNNGNYEPGNVRWATPFEQNNNKRNNHYITIRTWVLTISQWGHFSGINQRTIYYRLKRGWAPEKAIFYPLIKHK